MTEISFQFIGITSIVLLVLAIILMVFRRTRKVAVLISSLAVLVLTFYIVNLWIELHRPPLRTLGETRLWYGFFLSLLGVLLWFRWKYVWLFIYANVTATVFITIDLLNPAALDQTLMPALQSVWFVPHVVVYIIGYALLGVSALAAAIRLILPLFGKEIKLSMDYTDNTVYFGIAFLTVGIIFGALWAKAAWGHYWTWDPKETWAFITWMTYLIYIHLRLRQPGNEKVVSWILIFAFVFLMITWLGIQYLPAAQNSVHTY
ncbi:MAG: cytochrome C assembly protein [Bacteroidetes bacterium GWF2_43_63]|nr:MAG: cytochrome C assembly protein [Bacteroidetes bacterium GWE2_42_42]OFY54034.1 MAG: cytochrome C assembly protein [Bacteroidetes bacterium GWF2_43_63]HCB63558.1 cytochrome C assembly protein [Bacteroidales bacterium]HCY23196.1 cytochrome C assembly protein [Bacteroidales bacterium]